MATETLPKRATPEAAPAGERSLGRVLGHPLAYLATTAILLALFGWTFVANPGRPAPADDPAYYSWRTEAVIANPPVTLLEIDGPMDMFSGGYRVTTPVISAYLRSLAGVDRLTPTVLLAVGLRVLIPLLLAGFAYRHRRDPLIWHSVALGSASLLMTPPFGGYLDNVLTLFFLVASLFFIASARDLWTSRIAFGTLLLLSGMTHPTTLAAFCVVLGAMAAARLIYRRFDLFSVIRDDGPMLATAFVAALATYAVWRIGIWGQAAPLSDAALPPPAGSDFFKTRLSGWVEALRPALNGPLLLFGAVGLIAAGRRAMEDELSRVAIVWLAPLAGTFGFLAGIAYPYYRFFNTTAAWLLLVGVGIYFAARFFIAVSRGGGARRFALVGLVALAFVVGTNFTAGFEQSHWNDPSDAWIKPDQKEQLEAVKAALDDVPSDTPVVFVVDDDAPEPVRIYGFAKLAGNVTRYGVPSAQQDLASYYLGSLESFLNDEPSERGDEYYRSLSAASLDEAREVLEASDRPPIVIVPSAFNTTGANPTEGLQLIGDSPNADVWLANGQEIVSLTARELLEVSPEGRGGPLRIPITLGVLALLAIPGLLLFRALFAGGALPLGLGLVPALSVALLATVGIVLLAVFRSPFGSTLAALGLAISVAVAVAFYLRQRPPLAQARV